MKIVKSDTFPIVLQVVERIANLVKPTFGKRGKGVLIDNGFNASVLDDGYTILEELEFDDEVENSILRFIRETTRKANTRAGDGTTASLLLLNDLLHNLDEARGGDETALLDELKEASTKAVTELRGKADPITTLEELKKAALVSFRNEEVASMVGELVHKTGVDGVITVEESELLESSMEVKEGFFFERGFISPYFLNQANGTSELKKPYIFLTEDPVSRLAIIRPLLESAVAGNPVLFIGDIDGEALQTALINKLQKNLNICIVKPPAGNKTFYEDVSLVTGAKVFALSRGDEVASLDICGRAEKIIITEKDTTIVGTGGDYEKIKEKIEELKGSLTKATVPQQTQIKKRIGSLSNGIGVLRIGGKSDGERRYIKAKADDAVHSTQLALKSGVVRGGGVAMASVKTGFEPLDKALQLPSTIINEPDNEVFDAVEVNVSSIESAVSIASVLFNSEGIITLKNEPPIK